ncbi:carbohydrate sulfotransferase 1-like [Liolophura sinensis]|uniref:carbohydrate sulfotransferase 1-like n=1 Tax=Liolophura sinensis TaxID=3198878 RepID=UPI0031591C61
MEECAEELGSASLGSPIRVIKTIRTPMRFVTELLKKDPSVKVIHLLRDPRGLINSWITYDYKPKKDILPQYVCNLIGDDLKTRYELEKQYPGTFLEVIYEDLAQHPMEMLHKIYGWLGVPVDPKVTDWLNKSTHSDKDGKFLDTYKKNSTAAAYSWIKKISVERLNLINKFCGDLISHGNFPTISSEAELDEFTVPDRTL